MSGRGDATVLRIAVAAGFVAAGTCAWLLVAKGLDGSEHLQQAGCDLCTVEAPVTRAPTTPPFHEGRPMPTGPAHVLAASGSGPTGPTLSADTSPTAASAPASKSSSSPSSPGSGPTVRFTVTGQWDSGYRADVTLVNTTPVALTGWRLAFQVPGATLLNSDNSAFTASGDQATLTPAAWDPTIAPGAVLDLGLTFSGTGQNPSACVLDGSPCTFRTVPPNQMPAKVSPATTATGVATP